MIFQPELAEKILRGEKTVTRRPRTGRTVDGRWRDDPCRYKAGGGPGGTYAVQPGRGKPAVGRIEVVSVRAETMCEMEDADAEREGFRSRREFQDAWLAIYGRGSWLDPVWRIEFRLAGP